MKRTLTRRAVGTSLRHPETTRHNHTTMTGSRSTFDGARKYSKCMMVAEKFVEAIVLYTFWKRVLSDFFGKE
jgi:hypothetical protein